MTMSKVAVKVVMAAIVVGTGVGAWLFLGSRRDAPQSKEEVIRGIDSNLVSLAKDGFAGSLLLSLNGEVLLARGYGLADRAGGRLVTPDTGFDIGSLVKPFTAAAVLQLESQGKLRLEDSIGRFFPKAPPDKVRITVRELLDHSSGLPDIVDASSHPVDYTPAFDYEPVSRDEIVRRALNATLMYPPGQKSEYSNLGYSVLGAIIEQVSGQAYEEYVQENIFRPAGMIRTGYLVPGWKSHELAVGYYGGRPWGTPLEHSWLADGPSWNLRANGGMLSTVGDLYRWIQGLEGDAIFTATTKTKFATMSFHTNQRGARTMGVAGSNEIFDACYLWYPDEHRVLIMLTNSDKYRAEKMIPDLARAMRRIRTN
jgi:CubicO group peptidase (beta-lactamase class C family)